MYFSHVKGQMSLLYVGCRKFSTNWFVGNFCQNTYFSKKMRGIAIPKGISNIFRKNTHHFFIFSFFFKKKKNRKNKRKKKSKQNSSFTMTGQAPIAGVVRPPPEHFGWHRPLSMSIWTSIKALDFRISTALENKVNVYKKARKNFFKK